MKVPTGLARVDAANNDVDVWAYFALGVAGIDGVDADDRVYLSCVWVNLVLMMTLVAFPYNKRVFTPNAIIPVWVCALRTLRRRWLLPSDPVYTAAWGAGGDTVAVVVLPGIAVIVAGYAVAVAAVLLSVVGDAVMVCSLVPYITSTPPTSPIPRKRASRKGVLDVSLVRL